MSTRGQPRITVLCVDDEPGMAALIGEFLERADNRLTTITTTNAADALEAFQTTAIDCVVSDYDMPNMNGLELLDRIRETDSDLPFILFTGRKPTDLNTNVTHPSLTSHIQKRSGTEQYSSLAQDITDAVNSLRGKPRAGISSEPTDLAPETTSEELTQG